MKTAVYPGSFNPWHTGHQDILEKALKVFDEVVIAQGINPDKKFSDILAPQVVVGEKRIRCAKFSGLLVDFVKAQKFDAVIRGLRNGHDLQYEMNQQYWNEDLGLEIPTVYFITDRTLGHISSSTVRMLNKLNNN